MLLTEQSAATHVQVYKTNYQPKQTIVQVVWERLTSPANYWHRSESCGPDYTHDLMNRTVCCKKIIISYCYIKKRNKKKRKTNTQRKHTENKRVKNGVGEGEGGTDRHNECVVGMCQGDVILP